MYQVAEMTRRKVGMGCDTDGCEGDFHSRWKATDEELCKKCYNRKYMREKRRMETCEVSRCGKEVAVERENRRHCRFHHNLLFHTPDTQMYRSKEICACLDYTPSELRELMGSYRTRHTTI
jgi:hypothetical protein